MTEKLKLLGCPFCGNVPEMQVEKSGDGKRDEFFVMCQNSKCFVGVRTFGFHFAKVAARHWNRRSIAAKGKKAA